ncbi:MAG TPA: FtsW/RodA/SpoVE family cell cycle protein [Bacillus bacterium]|nr:FtsW/RodA/SpoVE family cell cycle protein [Bacillus sp. (in: firmicutes)]
MGLSLLPIISLGEIKHLDNEHLLQNKVIFVIIGVAAAISMMLIDYRRLEKYGWMFYGIGVLILLMTSSFANGMIVGQLIFEIGSVRIKSIMALPFLFLAWAPFFNNSKLNIWQLGGLFLFPLYLFLRTPNIPVAFSYTVIVFVMLWWSKIGRKKVIFITVGYACLALIGSSLSWSLLHEYQKERILGFLNPEEYANDAGFLYLRLKELTSSVGWLGTFVKQNSIPVAHTDFVFASLTNYYGYLFAIVLVAILALFIVRMVVISYKIIDDFGKLLVVGGIALYAVPFVYNISMTLGLLPIAGVSLPFISYGLMPTVMNAFIMGVVLSVYRRKDLVLCSKNA